MIKYWSIPIQYSQYFIQLFLVFPSDTFSFPRTHPDNKSLVAVSSPEALLCCDNMSTIPHFFLFFSHTRSIWKFLGQGLNHSCISDPHHSSGNAGSLTCSSWLGIEPGMPQRQARSLNHCTTVETLICSSFLMITTDLKGTHLVFCRMTLNWD